MLRDHVESRPGRHRAPYQGQPGPRIHPPRQNRRRSDDHVGQSRHDVDSQLRPGRVAARTRQADRHHVRRTRDGTRADGDRSGVDARVAVQGQRPGHAIHHAGVEGGQGAARLHLLGRLEQKTHSTGEVASAGQTGQCQPGAEHRGGMDIVAASVGNTRCGGAVRDRLFVVDRQSIQVSPQEHGGSTRLADDVTYHAGPARHGDGVQPHFPQHVGDEGRGAGLAPGQLGMGVDVAAHLHHGLGQPIEGAVPRLVRGFAVHRLTVSSLGSAHPAVSPEVGEPGFTFSLATVGAG